MVCLHLEYVPIPNLPLPTHHPNIIECAIEILIDRVCVLYVCLHSIFFPKEIPSAIVQTTATGNNLNINLPEKNAILRLEVELRDKNARRRPNRKGNATDRNRAAPSNEAHIRQTHPIAGNANNFFVPMEKVSGTILYIVLL